MLRLSQLESRLGQEEASFAVLRFLTLAGGVVALLLIPLRPEHTHHLVPLIAFFFAYNGLLSLLILLWPKWRRRLFLWALAFDLVFVFFLVWFTGGLESHFYLLFYLLIALNAYYFGATVGLLGALASALLYTVDFSLTSSAFLHWTHLAARVSLFGLLGGSLGFLSERERRARAEVEKLNRELELRRASLEAAYHHLQEVQDRLIQSERLAIIGRMAAKVAHEVRSPLSAISLNAELLEDEIKGYPGAPTKEAMDLLQSIKSQLEALSDLIEEYLSFTRLPKPRLERESLGEILDDLLRFLKGEIAERGIMVKEEFDQRAPWIMVDRRRLRQALLNILRNAFEAMPHGGNLTISTRIKGENVDIAIADTGIGIPPDQQERIFEPFFTTKDRGSGLGLTIAKQIIEEHGGTIACSSGLGRGTTFTISVPISREEQKE